MTATDLRPYVPLNVHTHYSVLQAASKIPDLVQRAQELNMPALAITDYGSMHGAIELYSHAKAAGIKPILGCEVFLIEGDITDRSTRKPHSRLVLLAKDAMGYRNLVRLVSHGHLVGFYYRPRINWEILEAHAEGLVAIAEAMGGPVGHALVRGNAEEAEARARRLKAMFGEDLYFELQDHGQEVEAGVNTQTYQLAQRLGVPVVVSNDSHFTTPQEEVPHQILLCMKDGKTLHDPTRRQAFGPAFYLKSSQELMAGFKHLESGVLQTALENTLKIAERCNLTLEMGKSILPDYPLDAGVSAQDELRRVVEEHARNRYGSLSQTVRDRLDYELGVINQMGFPTYFLIVWDFIKYARSNGIPVGPGRGSAAGSLVAYVLGITNIDPLEHTLLFERFLNPERISMPDIDIDFCIERRDDVIRYVSQRYGQDRVCQIATFGTLAARAALKAVGRVLDIPFAESDRLAKMIPFGPGMKLQHALEKDQPLQKEYEGNPQVKELVDLALQMEGTVCNVGTHAAGVVISKDPLSDLVPLMHSKDGNVISQYPMGDLEKLGMLKMDFLGLRNLTIIDNAIELIRTHHDGEAPDMDHLPLDDAKVYEVLTSGETDGVFQLESGGMKALVKDLKPSVFEDINALVALFRPGPLNSGMAKSFVDRKHGREQVTYQHPALEPILNATYGTIVYQEQIMQVAQSLAGYSLGQADLLRRAMGKKKADVMAQERDGFLAGALKNGVDEALANDLFNKMSEFAAYCFNRSHSAAYAMIAYQTAYLKVHFPVEYLSALLSSVRNDMDKIQHYILTARSLGIKVLPPDIAQSGLEFTPAGGDIRFGLASVKNVGVGVVEAILKARAEKPFEDLADFCRRIDPKVLNKKTLESLIRCGAFSSFGITRKQLLQNIEALVRFAEREQAQKMTGQVSLFSAMGGGDAASGENASFGGLILSGDPTAEWTNAEIQRAEKELLGFFVSSHPLDDLVETLPLLVTHATADLKDVADGAFVAVGGLITQAQQKLTRKNKPLCVLQLEDFSGHVECVAFSDTLEKLLGEKLLGEKLAGEKLAENKLSAEKPSPEADEGPLLAEGRKVILYGTVQFRGDDGEQVSVIVRDAKPVEALRPVALRCLVTPRYEDVMGLRDLLVKHTGPNPVVLAMPDGTRIQTGQKFWVGHNREGLTKALSESFAGQLQLV